MAMENPPLENMLIGDFPASYLWLPSKGEPPGPVGISWTVQDDEEDKRLMEQINKVRVPPRARSGRLVKWQ